MSNSVLKFNFQLKTLLLTYVKENDDCSLTVTDIVTGSVVWKGFISHFQFEREYQKYLEVKEKK